MSRADIYNRVKELIDNRRSEARNLSNIRSAELEMRSDELREIGAELRAIGPMIFKTALEGGDIAPIKERNLKLNERRREIIKSLGYPEDYCKPHYECDRCQDSGYIGIRMCACMRRRLTEAGLESSGLGNLMKKQAFENFSLEYYRQNAAQYAQMKEHFQAVRGYAEGFTMEGENTPDSLLFMGGTGLGKTHLSTAVARTVIERGYDVFYNSAVGMISDFETRRFGNSIAIADADNTERYITCDLLILDDLGTEVVNQFTQSTLYYVINTRLNAGRPTIISTNLTGNDLRKTYSDRITSRLMGEYRIIPFFGTDIRKQKLN